MGAKHEVEARKGCVDAEREETPCREYCARRERPLGPS
jgi:hypothetical protein